jgi:hypothetical protein
LALLHFYVRLHVRLEKMEMWQNVRLGALVFLVGVSTVLESRGLVAYNDLRASEGREIKALNCKPNTNLKEI